MASVWLDPEPAKYLPQQQLCSLVISATGYVAGMNTLPSLIGRIVGAIESAHHLDGVADAVAGRVSAVIPDGRMTDLASGTATGHPLHPPLATATIGAVVSVALLDVVGGDPRNTRTLLGVGVLSALPTVYAGASDWTYTAGPERRVGLIHGLTNAVAMACLARSWVSRRRGRTASNVALSLLGTVLLAAGGSLGGHLAYAMGVGVDTTAFTPLDVGWTDAAAEKDIPASGALGVRVADVPVLLARDGDRIVALADRCTHRGAPLHEGAVVDGCVECPWHGSRFRLSDGSVERGPAVRPQPVLQARVVDGRVEISRHEERTLRTRPV